MTTDKKKHWNDRVLAWGTAAGSALVALGMFFGIVRDYYALRADVAVIKCDVAWLRDALTRETHDHLVGNP